VHVGADDRRRAARGADDRARARAGLLRPNTSTISGFNLNDGAVFVPGYGDGAMLDMDAAGLAGYYANRFGEEHVPVSGVFFRLRGDAFRTQVTALEDAFPVPAGFPGADGRGYSSYFYSAQQCETDYSYACAAFWYSEAFGSSYVYHFVEPTQGGLVYHGDEIGYVFGTLADPTPAQSALSATMMGYWAAFAATGDPNGGGRPEWPAWSATRKMLNASAAPYSVAVPLDAYVGCRFFANESDYLLGCLPVHDDDA